VEYELTVDDDEPSVVITCEPPYPFSSQMKKCVTGFINKRCAVMVNELALKGKGLFLMQGSVFIRLIWWFIRFFLFI
jgi:hypothetical protein